MPPTTRRNPKVVADDYYLVAGMKPVATGLIDNPGSTNAWSGGIFSRHPFITAGKEGLLFN